MLRRTPLVRKTALRNKTPVRRVALRRGGLSKDERLELNDMARTVVMVKFGAVLMPHATGKGAGWYGRCLHCRLERPLQWAHIFPQGTCPHMRWDTGNAVALCWRCHDGWWHSVADLDALKEWVVGVIGDREWQRLKFRSQVKGQKQDWELVRLGLRLELKAMGVEWGS